MNCSSCQYANPDGAVFCTQCGTRINWDVTPLYEVHGGQPVANTGSTTKLETYNIPSSQALKKSFKTRNIAIGQMLGDIEIVEVDSGQDTTVEIYGDSEQVLKFEANLVRGTLELSCPLPLKKESEGNAVSTILKKILKSTGSSFTSSVTVNGTTYVNHNGGEIDTTRTVTCRILVPVGSRIHLQADGLIGQIQVHDLTSPLSFKLTDAKRVAFGQVRDFEFTNDSSTTVTVAYASGYLKANMNDRGGLRIADGDISDLNIDSDGSGDFEYAGDVYNKLSVNLNDRGNIFVAKGNVKEVEFTSNGSGKFVYFGKVNGSILCNLNDRGDARLGNIIGSSKVTLDGSGSFEAESVEGKVLIKSNDRGTATFGYINGTSDINLNGSGNFEAQSVNGEILINIKDRGAAKIAGGTSTFLQINIDGSANASYNGTSARTEIKITDRGSATIAQVFGKAKVISNGSGNTTLKAGRLQLFEAFVKDCGSITFGGVSDNAVFNNDGSGNINGGRCINPPQVSQTDRGKNNYN